MYKNILKFLKFSAIIIFILVIVLGLRILSVLDINYLINVLDEIKLAYSEQLMYMDGLPDSDSTGSGSTRPQVNNPEPSNTGGISGFIVDDYYKKSVELANIQKQNLARAIFNQEFVNTLQERRQLIEVLIRERNQVMLESPQNIPRITALINQINGQTVECNLLAQKCSLNDKINSIVRQLTTDTIFKPRPSTTKEAFAHLSSSTNSAREWVDLTLERLHVDKELIRTERHLKECKAIADSFKK